MNRKSLPPELTALLERPVTLTDRADDLSQFEGNKYAVWVAQARLKDPPRQATGHLLYASILSLVFWIALGVVVAAWVWF